MAEKKTNWIQRECVGGPFDGLVVSIWENVQSVVLVNRHNVRCEYVNPRGKQGAIIADVAIVGSTHAPKCKSIKYNGQLTEAEWKIAKTVASQGWKAVKGS